MCACGSFSASGEPFVVASVEETDILDLEIGEYTCVSTIAVGNLAALTFDVD